MDIKLKNNYLSKNIKHKKNEKINGFVSVYRKQHIIPVPLN
jgi:hypothetical protein